MDDPAHIAEGCKVCWVSPPETSRFVRPDSVDDSQLVTDGGERLGDVAQLEGVESGDVAEFELSDTDGVHQATVGPKIVEPPFPPEDVAEDQLPGQIQVSLENTDTATKWCLSREIDPDEGLTGPVTASVKACIDIRHPPRYRWQDRGTVESLEVVDDA
ncbi:hypothetical protein [Halopenitus malekzadehii]|uniref:hypothetical protein n=1 Tax=Halopenitus malekzadehii TaxID=1267564 RepID=UPI00115F8130|nr:hypothetical protein [Halopenitus malekzadehii]